MNGSGMVSCCNLKSKPSLSTLYPLSLSLLVIEECSIGPGVVGASSPKPIGLLENLISCTMFGRNPAWLSFSRFVYFTVLN